MTRNSRARGRSPELQELLDEAVGTPVLPVQRMIPGQRGARDHHFAALPEQRGSTDPGRQRPGFGRLSSGPALGDVASVASRTSRRRIAVRSGDRPALRTPPRSKRRRTARPLHLRVVTTRLARRPTRAASGPATRRKARRHQQRGPLALTVRTLAAARPRSRRAVPAEEPQNRLTLNVRALNIRTLGTAHVDLRELDTRAAVLRTAVIRDLEVHPLPPPVVPTEAATAGTDARSGPTLATKASPTVLPMLPPAAPIRPAEVAVDDHEPGGQNLPPRHSHRPRAVLLAGGVAAAVIAIVAVVVFAVGQRSGTAPGAERSGSGAAGSSPTVARSTAAAAPPAAANAAASAKAATRTTGGDTTTAARATQAATPLVAPTTTPRPEAAAGAPGNNTGSVTAATAEPSATGQTPTEAPSTADNPAPAGNGNTATVVTGISKLTGWVVLSPPSSP